jgi:hypothetical protein
MRRSTRIFSLVSLAFLLLLDSCGIEDYLFLYPVSPGNIRVELNSLSSIDLPDINLNEYYYFTYFSIYYRIYVSDIPESGTIQLSQSGLTRINPTLYSDYAAFEPYTNNDTMITTSLASLFRNRNYYTLALQNTNIEDVLSSASLGKTISLDFAQRPGTYPSLNLYANAALESTYTLYRSNGNNAFNPQPTRYFVNTTDLSRSDYLTTAINADVAPNSAAAAGGTRYTYVSMYIVVTGMDPNYSPIFSRPTHVGIFRLPDPN